MSLCQLTDCCRRGKVKGDKVGEGEGRRGGGRERGCTCICMQDPLLQIHSNAFYSEPTHFAKLCQTHAVKYVRMHILA